MSDSVVTATRAFRRTKCRECGKYIVVGVRVVSSADGFRHVHCHLNHRRDNL